ncbi:penicillin-binding transpeptidase domain-containing protein, partial [Escherichia coli]|nr:penicillin-binding transpeptidase domain-containing protein [Escherichia coli]
MGKYEPNHIIESNDNDVARQVVSKENARLVLDMLETVTQKGGSARRAAVPGYRVGAKTGTARKASAGGYSDE